MDDPYIVVIFIPEHRIVTDIHIGGSHQLRVISQELVSGLFRDISGILQADHPVDPVQVRDGTVILVLGSDKCNKQQDHRQAQGESTDRDDREKLVPLQRPEVNDEVFHGVQDRIKA